MYNLGRTLSRRYSRCMEKMSENLRILLACGKDDATLQAEWKLQVEAQSKPVLSKFPCPIERCADTDLSDRTTKKCRLKTY